MRSGFRIALATAAVAAGVAFAGATPAQAQVRIAGSFPLPHGRISIGIGAPDFPVGTYVPNGYDVYSDPESGYGFEYESRWIPVRQYSGRWLVCEPSQAYGYTGGYDTYGYTGGHGSYGYRGGYDRYYGRQTNRYNVRPSYGYRGHGERYQRRDRDDRWDRRDRDRDHDRRWRN